MATMTHEHEVLDLEKQFWQAIRDKDLDAALRLTDDPCILTGSQGVMQIGREQFMDMMKGANFTLHRFAFQGEPRYACCGTTWRLSLTR